MASSLDELLTTSKTDSELDALIQKTEAQKKPGLVTRIFGRKDTTKQEKPTKKVSAPAPPSVTQTQKAKTALAVAPGHTTTAKPQPGTQRVSAPVPASVRQPQKAQTARKIAPGFTPPPPPGKTQDIVNRYNLLAELNKEQAKQQRIGTFENPGWEAIKQALLSGLSGAAVGAVEQITQGITPRMGVVEEIADPVSRQLAYWGMAPLVMVGAGQALRGISRAAAASRYARFLKPIAKAGTVVGKMNKAIESAPIGKRLALGALKGAGEGAAFAGVTSAGRALVRRESVKDMLRDMQASGPGTIAIGAALGLVGHMFGKPPVGPEKIEVRQISRRGRTYTATRRPMGLKPVSETPGGAVPPETPPSTPVPEVPPSGRPPEVPPAGRETGVPVPEGNTPGTTDTSGVPRSREESPIWRQYEEAIAARKGATKPKQGVMPFEGKPTPVKDYGDLLVVYTKDKGAVVLHKHTGEELLRTTDRSAAEHAVVALADEDWKFTKAEDMPQQTRQAYDEYVLHHVSGQQLPVEQSEEYAARRLRRFAGEKEPEVPATEHVDIEDETPEASRTKEFEQIFENKTFSDVHTAVTDMKEKTSIPSERNITIQQKGRAKTTTYKATAYGPLAVFQTKDGKYAIFHIPSNSILKLGIKDEATAKRAALSLTHLDWGFTDTREMPPQTAKTAFDYFKYVVEPEKHNVTREQTESYLRKVLPDIIRDTEPTLSKRYAIEELLDTKVLPESRKSGSTSETPLPESPVNKELAEKAAASRQKNHQYIDDAVAKNKLDPGAAKLAHQLIDVFPDELTSDLAIKVSYTTQKATAKILADHGVDPSVAGDYAITAETLSNFENGVAKTIIKLYKGHTPDDVVEEFYHAAWNAISDPNSPLYDKRLADAYIEFHNSRAGETRAVHEAFAQDGTRAFFGHKLYEQSGPIRELFARVRDWLLEVLDRVRAYQKSVETGEIPKWVDDVYLKIGKGEHFKSGTRPVAPEAQGAPAAPEVSRAIKPVGGQENAPRKPKQTGEIPATESVSQPTGEMPATEGVIPTTTTKKLEIPERPTASDIVKEGSSSHQNAVTLEERLKYQMPKLPERDSVNLKRVINEAVSSVDEGAINPDKIVDEVNNNINRRLTLTEQGALLYRREQLINEVKLLDPANPNRKTASPEQLRRAQEALDKLDQLHRATVRAGTEWGLEGLMRQMIIKDDYSLAHRLLLKRIQMGVSKLPAEVEEQVAEQVRRYQEAEKNYLAIIDELQSKSKASEEKIAALKKELEDIKRQGAEALGLSEEEVGAYYTRRAGGGGVGPAIQKVGKKYTLVENNLPARSMALYSKLKQTFAQPGTSVAQSIRQITSESAPPPELPENVNPEHVEMLTDFVLSTIPGAHRISYKKFFAIVHDILPEVPRDVVRASFQQVTYEFRHDIELKRTIADLEALEKYLEDPSQDPGPPPPMRISNELARLKAERNKLQQQYAQSPANQQVYLEARIKRLDEKISILKEHIESGTPLPSKVKTAVLKSPELEERYKEIRRLYAMADEMFGKVAQRNKTNLEKALQRERELRQILESGGELPPTQKRKVNAELAAVNKRIAALRREIAKRSETSAIKLEKAKSRIREKIQRQRAILRGELERQPRKTQTFDIDAEYKELVKLSKKLDREIRKQYPGRPLTQQEKLGRAYQAVQRQIERIKEYRERGEPLPKREQLVPDERLIEARKELARQRMLLKMETEPLPTKSFWRRLTDYQRAAVLSGYSVIEKLFGATIWTLPTEMLADVFSPLGANLKIGGKKLVDLGASEGVFSPRAQLEMVKGTLSRKAVNNAFKMLKEHLNEFYEAIDSAGADELGGRRARDLFERVMDIPGSVHGAEKSFMQTGAYNKSLRKRLIIAMRQGRNINDPQVQMEIHLGACADSIEMILQNDSVATKFVRSVIGAAHRAHPAFGSAVKSFAPVVRVALNWLGRSIQMSGAGVLEGGIRYGAAKLRFAKTGVLPTPEEADKIMKAFKYGGVGLVTAYLGLAQPYWFKTAGYDRHSTNEGTDGLPLEPDTMEIFGIKIPKILTHAPFLNAVQFWATVRRMMIDVGWGEAIGQAGAGLAEQLPGAITIQNMRYAPTVSAALGRHATTFIPQLIKQIAVAQDKNPEGEPIRRQTMTFTDELKAAIPGLRQTLPEKSRGRGVRRRTRRRR